LILKEVLDVVFFSSYVLDLFTVVVY